MNIAGALAKAQGMQDKLIETRIKKMKAEILKEVKEYIDIEMKKK